MDETNKRKDQIEEGFDLKAAYTALIEGYVEFKLAQRKRKKRGKKNGTSTAL